jgi:hypothetical protein
MRRLLARLSAKPLLAVFSVALMACHEDTVVVVESDTIWHGDIDQYGTVEGRGNAQFDISEAKDKICWTFVKQSDGGTLRVYADDDTWFGLGSQIDGEQTTRAAHGTVRGCAQ